MFNHLSIGVRDLAAAKTFYDALFLPLGHAAALASEVEVAYGPAGGEGLFWLYPVQGERVAGLGTHIAFSAHSEAAVLAAAAAAVANGASVIRAAGEHPDIAPDYYRRRAARSRRQQDRDCDHHHALRRRSRFIGAGAGDAPNRKETVPMRRAAALLLLTLAGPTFAASGDWRRDARPDDARRLDGLPSAWATALRQARRDGHGAELRALGALADPRAGLDRPDPRRAPIAAVRSSWATAVTTCCPTSPIPGSAAGWS